MKIYALLDYASVLQKGITLEAFVQICENKGALFLQYRDKISSPETKVKNLKYLRTLWHKTLIVNDDLQLTAYCDGVHLGQEDLAAVATDKREAAAIVRSRIGQNKILGISTHNYEEIIEANQLDLDYIGLGAYRNTATKEVTHILGSQLPALAALSKHPVAAIGGVKLHDQIENVAYLVIGSGLYEN